MSKRIYSDEFTDRPGFNRAYKALRGDVLVAHGHDHDAKGVRVASGVIEMDWLAAPERWVRFTNDRATMIERVDLATKHATLPGMWRLTAVVPA